VNGGTAHNPTGGPIQINEKERARLEAEALAEIQKIVGTAVKEALIACVVHACSTAGSEGGFRKEGPLDKDPALKQYVIEHFPDELKSLEDGLRGVMLNPFGKQCDDFVNLLAEGAEKAAKACEPIFTKAVADLSIENARLLLEAEEGEACTKYLDEKCRATLMTDCKPVVDEVLSSSTVNTAWVTLRDGYNSLPMISNKIEWDLAAWVLKRAVDAVFASIGCREVAFRKDPEVSAATATIDLFGNIQYLKGQKAADFLECLENLKAGKPCSNKSSNT